VSQVRVQPLEALFFSDDFMRQPTEAGDWTYRTGKWVIQTIGTVQWGANPFSLESTPNPTALASAGYPFWSNYWFEAAAKGSPGASFGICACLQDEKNYYRLRWSPGPGGALELQRVVNGKATTLARREGGFIPNLWYQLGLRTSMGRLVAEVDHQQVFSLEDDTFGAGKVGLYTEGNGTQLCWFDRVLLRPSHILYENLSPGGVHRWEIEDGKALGGSPDWRNYSVTVQVDGSNRMSGIPFRAADANNCYVFVWDEHGSSLVAIKGGTHRLLAASREGAAPAGHAPRPTTAR